MTVKSYTAKLRRQAQIINVKMAGADRQSVRLALAELYPRWSVAYLAEVAQW